MEAKREGGAEVKVTNVEGGRKVGERRRKIVLEMEGGDRKLGSHWRWGWLAMSRNHGERRERPLERGRRLEVQRSWYEYGHARVHS